MAKKQAKAQVKTKKHGWLKYIWLLLITGILAVALLFVLIAHGVIGYIPDIEELQNPKNKYASELYTSDGQIFGRYFYGKNNRVAVAYHEISPYVVQALQATEDIRFYEHSGIDGRSLFRAIVKRQALLFAFCFVLLFLLLH